ncbi:hypothetical protein [Nocardioides sp. CFH 31398]|uniref:hypothetical protein n=1 Tax=Nocardioides sp. CFH 31398 TaxID=2919579 RepID=UPI001F05B1C3|nr:hypothetical protein [Nocardioides sp. CFH 31398]MCH1865190.1 hypothetical protein [Nocardioides sp. CFH 31398]
MSTVLRFIAWVLGKAWRWGVRTVRAIAAYARRYWRVVWRWIERGVPFVTIAEWIMRSLGIG